MSNQTLKRVMGFMENYRFLFWLALLFSALSSVVSLGAYVYVYFVAKEVVIAKGQIGALDTAQISNYGWKAVAYISTAFGLYGLSLLMSHIVSFNTVAKLRIKLIKHLQHLPLGYFNNQSTGTLRKLVEKNSEELDHYIAHQSPDMVQAMTTPIAFLVCIFIFDWKLSIICLIPVLIGFLLLRFMIGGESETFLKQYQESAAKMSHDVVEYVRGISVVKVFGQTAFSFKSFNQSIKNYRDFTVKYALTMKEAMSGYIACVYGIFAVLIPAAIIFFNYSEDKERMILSYIFFVVFTPLVAFMLMRVMESSYNGMIITNAIDTLETSILNEQYLQTTSTPKTPSSNDIQFEDVHFYYEHADNKAINGLSFDSNAGSVTAIVGPSGSGKSTVFNLITRFWDANAGSIKIGNVDVRDMSYKDLMNRISYVFQETNLFKMSILENIKFYTPDATLAEVNRAVDLAQCRDIIDKMPNGLDTVIGAKGVYLSGGEQQRIAIARAVLKDAPIVLLDEATAFADAENEYKIQQALSTVMEGKTVLIIAHRLSTIVHADQILVLDNGRLVERGMHSTLIEQKGVYHNMYQEYQRSTGWKIGGVKV